jgi:NAD(P)-dependent dehydrogenase (short-subunit alcohol dehydrogenase family)
MRSVSSVRVHLVTGAGRGLGLALAEEVVARGHVVIGTLRDRGRGAGLVELAARAPERVWIAPLDVTDEQSCARLAGAVASVVSRVDVVVNNAGINAASPELGGQEQASSLAMLAAAAVDRMMWTNALGPILVTRALLALLAPGATVVNLSSRRGSLAGKLTGGNYGYCMSKAALNMATRALAADLADRAVVVALDPGCVRGTAMSQPDATLAPRDAAAAVLDLIEALGPEHRGRFLTTTGEDHPW